MNYLECLSKYFPTLEVLCFGDVNNYYDLIVQNGVNLPPKSELDSLIFNFIKEQKILELSNKCELVVTQGFTSSALGYDHVYDSEVVDQVNIIGSVTATSPTPDYPQGMPIPYAVRPIENGVVQPKIYKVHTHIQLRQALADGAIFKLGCLQHFNQLRDFIYTLTTKEEVEAVNWETTLT